MSIILINGEKLNSFCFKLTKRQAFVKLVKITKTQLFISFILGHNEKGVSFLESQLLPNRKKERKGERKLLSKSCRVTAAWEPR